MRESKDSSDSSDTGKKRHTERGKALTTVAPGSIRWARRRVRGKRRKGLETELGK